MPILDVGARAGNGAGLQSEGPKVAIEIGVPAVLAEFLSRRGSSVPPAWRGFALIDTGASVTAVDEEVIASLGIQPIGQMKLSTPNQSMPAWLYAVRPSFPEGAIPDLEILDAVGCSLQPQGFIALLGRNFLRKFVFVYDGPAGFFRLL